MKVDVVGDNERFEPCIFMYFFEFWPDWRIANIEEQRLTRRVSLSQFLKEDSWIARLLFVLETTQ